MRNVCDDVLSCGCVKEKVIIDERDVINSFISEIWMMDSDI